MPQPMYKEPEENIKVLFTPMTKNKIDIMVELVSTECAMEGFVEKLEDNTYLVTDVRMYPQVVTSTTVDSDDDAYPHWLENLTDTEIRTKKFQMHSHVNMGVSPSTVDLDLYMNYMSVATDYMIFMIQNKAGNYNIYLYDKEHNTIYDTKDITTGIYDMTYGNLTDIIANEVAENIKTKYTASKPKPKTKVTHKTIWNKPDVPEEEDDWKEQARLLDYGYGGCYI